MRIVVARLGCVRLDGVRGLNVVFMSSNSLTHQIAAPTSNSVLPQHHAMGHLNGTTTVTGPGEGRWGAQVSRVGAAPSRTCRVALSLACREGCAIGEKAAGFQNWPRFLKLLQPKLGSPLYSLSATVALLLHVLSLAHGGTTTADNGGTGGGGAALPGGRRVGGGGPRCL